MERDAERMEHDSDRVGDNIDEARKDWEAKEQDPSVPGAQPEPDEEQEAGAGADEEQEPVAGAQADESPGVPGEDDTATGNPDAAGSEEPDSGEDG